MARPWIVDLFCCQGGACAGFQRAGFRVLGVDKDPQPRYPGDDFLQADCLSPAVSKLLRLVDAAHASPACQFATELNSDKARHLNLIPPVRAMLLASGVLYSIENVRNARPHLNAPVSLFGTMFDCHMITSTGARFDLSRERLFETNWGLTAPPKPAARHPIANVYGGHLRVRSGAYRTGNGTGRTVDLPGEDRARLAKQLMGIPWATMDGLSEAIPPAYTEYVGRELMKRLDCYRVLS